MAFFFVARSTALYPGKLVFSQRMAYGSLRTFHCRVATHQGESKVQDFPGLGPSFVNTFAQLTY